MPRDQRLNVCDATYHVMNRGNRKSVIFEDVRDRRQFLRILDQTVCEFQVQILTSTLMGTHFHLVVLTPHGNLSEFMQQLEGRYAQYSNWRHGRVGHLFQGRFKGVRVENDIHLFTAVWYVVMNPVVAGYVSRPQDWVWSSYGATIGLRPVPGYLSIDWVETLFPARFLRESQQLFRHCVEDSQPVQAYFNCVEPNAEASTRAFVAVNALHVEQPCGYRILTRPPLELLFPAEQSRTELKTAITVAHETHGYKLVEIARCSRLSYPVVSKIYSAHRRSTAKTTDEFGV